MCVDLFSPMPRSAVESHRRANGGYTWLDLSGPQWLASFVLGVLIETALITVLGMFSLVGPPRHLLAELGSSTLIALALSAFHFGCLILGVTAAAVFGLVALELTVLVVTNFKSDLRDRRLPCIVSRVKR